MQLTNLYQVLQRRIGAISPTFVALPHLVWSFPHLCHCDCKTNVC